MTKLGIQLGAWALAGALLGAPATGPAATPAPPLHLETLGRPAQPAPPGALAGHVAILMFWRADCPPCRLEFEELDRLKNAAAGGRLILVGLQPAEDLRAGLKRMNRPASLSWRAQEDPALTLTRFGGAPPRLPLAAALSPDGEICAHHTGILGTDQVRQWIRQCGRTLHVER